MKWLQDTRSQPKAIKICFSLLVVLLMGRFLNIAGGPAMSIVRETPNVRRTLFYCDEKSANNILIANALFPEYEQTRPVSENPSPTDAILLTDETIAIATENDLLIAQMHMCDDVANPVPFPGKTLYLNGEYFDISPDRFSLNPNGQLTHNYLPKNDNAYVLGPHEDSERSIRVTELAMRLQIGGDRYRDKLFVHSNKPVNTKQNFLLYANSHYVSFREHAADALSQIGVIHTAGKCQGNVLPVDPGLNAVCEPFPDYTRLNRVQPLPKSSPCAAEGMRCSNDVLFRDYRFGLVMENHNSDGYITEKILHAFLAGTVPIWYGSVEIFDIFNRHAFIYYDVENPEPALEKIAYLEENSSAYNEVLREPILADGERTIEKYFSFEDSIGGGKLKRRIREMMGYSLEPMPETKGPI